MQRIQEIFPEIPVGYSDHTHGITVPLAAVALGARTIEKHYTVDKALPDSPDHSFSLDPEELEEMVARIREIESSIGTFTDGPSKAEERAFKYARKSMAAVVDIPKDTEIKASMITFKRPGTGIYPRYEKDVIGRKARKDIKEDETITWEMV